MSGCEARVDVERVGEHLLVIDDGKERPGDFGLRVSDWGTALICPQPLVTRAEDELKRQIGEPLDLLLPLGLERSGRDDEHALRLAQAVQQRAGGDGLDRLAEAHLVGEQGAFGECQVQHAFALIGKERHLGFVRRPFAALHFQFVFAPQLFAFVDAPPVLIHGATSCEMRSSGKSSRKRCNSAMACSGAPFSEAPFASNHSRTALGSYTVAVQQSQSPGVRDPAPDRCASNHSPRRTERDA